MKQTAVDISPLSMNQLTRDLWGDYDSRAIAQLAPLTQDRCYQPKFFKAPGDNQEVIPSLGYVPYGMRLKPGSIIFGFYLPLKPGLNVPQATYTVQITDQSLQRRWFDDPIANLFLANQKPTNEQGIASFPNLLTAPYPVVGSGLFLVDFQSTNKTESQRCQLVFGVLEVCGK
jgi:hypothetical protein